MLFNISHVFHGRLKEIEADCDVKVAVRTKRSISNIVIITEARTTSYVLHKWCSILLHTDSLVFIQTNSPSRCEAWCERHTICTPNRFGEKFSLNLLYVECVGNMHHIDLCSSPLFLFVHQTLRRILRNNSNIITITKGVLYGITLRNKTDVYAGKRTEYGRPFHLKCFLTYSPWTN